MGDWITDNALIVWEENSEILPPKGFEILDSRKYGATTITFLRYTPDPEPTQ